MIAAIYTGDGPIKVMKHRTPRVGPKDVRVMIEASGVCGTDIHILQGEYDSRPPVVLGHEFAGTVVETGVGVGNLKIGNRVTIEPHLYCGTCKFCVDGREHLCTNKQAFGVHLDGGFAEEVVVPARNAYLLPAGVPPSLGALAEPLGCCIHGLDQANIQLGMHVAVFGAGPIGLLLTRLASHSGATKVVVIEPGLERRHFAERYGATLTLSPEDAQDAILGLTNGYGMDIVFEATGRPDVFPEAFAATGRGGRLIVFGVTTPQARVSLPPFRIYREEIEIKGSLTNPYAHRRAIELLPHLGIDDLISHTFALKDMTKAITIARKGVGLKVQIAPNR